jgi:hypothetical protein
MRELLLHSLSSLSLADLQTQAVAEGVVVPAERGQDRAALIAALSEKHGLTTPAVPAPRGNLGFAGSEL